MNETSSIVTPLIKALNGIPGVFAHRVLSGNAAVRGGRVHGAEKGTPDVHVTVRGMSLWFEAKLAKSGRVSPEQLAQHARLRRAGARVEVVTSVAEGIATVREILEES